MEFHLRFEESIRMDSLLVVFYRSIMDIVPGFRLHGMLGALGFLRNMGGIRSYATG